MASAHLPELLLHPVRFRLVQTMLDRRERTASMLAQAVPEISRATVYRHIALLAKAGVLKSLHREKRRGSTEITYGINPTAARFQAEDIAKMSRAQIERLFLTFWTGVLTTASSAMRDQANSVDDLRFFTLGFKADAAGFTQVMARLLELFSECDAASPNGDFRVASIVMHPGAKQFPPSSVRDTRKELGT